MDLKSIKPQDVISMTRRLLGMSGNRIVGIDIGFSSVKLAELEKSGDTLRLVNYIAKPLPQFCLVEDEVQDEEALIEAITQGLDELNMSDKNVTIGLWGPNTVVRKLQVAGGTHEEIEDQVYWESEQYLPFAIEECSLDFFEVGENIGGGVDVIVAAAKNNVLFSFKDIAEKAGGLVKFVDVVPVALSNLFEISMQDEIDEAEQGSSWLLLDIGAQKAECVIYKDEMPVFTKSIQIGGSMITEEIQRQLGVNFEEAEDLKVTVDESGNLPEEVAGIVNDINQTFYDEIKKTVDFYINSTSDDSLVACYATGGTVQIPGLLEGITEALGIDVSVINPFRALEYDEDKFDEEILSEIAYKGVVALGLAMRQLR